MNAAPHFRSRLEREVADELDEHGVIWTYEQPAQLPAGIVFHYLPDFTVDTAQPRQDPTPLPQWIEVKPQEFLYDLRDTLRVTRQYGERFAGTVSVETTAKDLYERQVEELWKPKYLAEVTGQTVWVVGGVGGTSRLSVAMTASAVEFTRDNWFVNWPGTQARRKREERRRELEERASEWQAERERIAADLALKAQQRLKQATDTVAAIKAYPARGANRHPGVCPGDQTWVNPGEGTLHNVTLVGGGSQWFVLCAKCEATS